MQKPQSAQITDPSGQSFSAWLTPVEGAEDTPQAVMLQLTDGTQFMLPRDLLTPTGDGRYALSVNFHEVAQQAAAPSGNAGETVVSLAEEVLQVGKRTVERGRVRLHKTVSERLETVDVPLLREQIEVERVSVNRPVDEAEPVRYEGDVMVIARFEEVLVVSKQLVLVEELRVRKVRSEQREPQQVTLRREELSVERGDADTEVLGDRKMHEDATSGLDLPDRLSAAEAAFSRSPYYDDVARLLGTLNLYLPTYEARLGTDTYGLVHSNLQVLTNCFYSEPLVPEALEVIYEHLLTLTRMLAFRTN